MHIGQCLRRLGHCVADYDEVDQYMAELPGVFADAGALLLACAVINPVVEEEQQREHLLYELSELDISLPRTTEDSLLACSVAGVGALPAAVVEKFNYKRQLRVQYTGDVIAPSPVGSKLFSSPDCPNLGQFLYVQPLDIEEFQLRPCAQCERNCFNQPQ